MTLFAVAIRDYSVAYIEFSWADNEEEAIDKVMNLHPTARFICAKEVPGSALFSA